VPPCGAVALDVEAEDDLVATGFLTGSNGLRFIVVEVSLIPGLVVAGVDDLDCVSDDSILAFFAGGSSAEAVGRRGRSGGTNFFIGRLLAGLLSGSWSVVKGRRGGVAVGRPVAGRAMMVV